ncbi:glycosyltransferase family 4 protein [Rhodococcus aerolatus]
MRIVHVSDVYLPRLGGIEMQVHDLAAHQQAAGHDVTVITPTGAGEGPEAPGVPVVRLPGTGPIGAGDALRAGTADADVVHLHASLVSPTVWRTGAQLTTSGTPFAVTMHSVPPPGWVLRAVGTTVGWTRWPARWTAVSDVAARPLRGMLPRTEVGVLHNGIDVEWWRSTERAADDGVVTLVSVMRLAQRKRPLHLLRTLRRVRALVPASVPLRAEIIGSGPMHDKVAAALHRYGLEGWVELRGQLTREEIRETYRRADVYLAPATLESFGIAALEARSAGLPVVAMAVGGVGEFVRDGVEGFLVGSYREMAEATARLATHAGALRAMSEHNLGTPPPMGWDDVVARCDEHYALATALRRGTRSSVATG